MKLSNIRYPRTSQERRFSDMGLEDEAPVKVKMRCRKLPTHFSDLKKCVNSKPKGKR